MPPNKKLDLYVEIDVLTGGSTAEIINAIFETLLYQRNQIPFVYKTYRHYVNKWKEQQLDIEDEVCDVLSFQIQRIKQQATVTKEAISSMRETIKSISQQKVVKTLRFLFGSTIFTAKEAYTVHIPTENIAANHFHEHHKIAPRKLNQTLLSLLTNESLYSVFSHNLKPTNVYLELELLESENTENAYEDPLLRSEIFQKEFFPLPSSCTDIHIYIQQEHSSNYEQLTCCRELQVFEDLVALSLNCNSEKQNNSCKENNAKKGTNSKSAWWEAEIFVRGFKDQPTKKLNIWT